MCGVEASSSNRDHHKRVPIRALKQFLLLHVKANCREFTAYGVWTTRLSNATMHVLIADLLDKARD